MADFFGALAPILAALFFLYVGGRALIKGEISSSMYIHRTMRGNLPRVIGTIMLILGVLILSYIFKLLA